MNQKLSNNQLNRLSPDEAITKNKLDLFVVLDNVRSLNNVGSVFRTSDAFGVRKIFLCGITGTPPDREIHKTALGAELSINWQYKDNCLELVRQLMKEKVNVFAVEQTSNSSTLKNAFNNIEGPIALVFGNEVNGVDQDIIDICNGSIEIPQLGSKHSLNVSVSLGVVLWEFLRTKI